MLTYGAFCLIKIWQEAIRELKGAIRFSESVLQKLRDSQQISKTGNVVWLGDRVPSEG